MQGTTGKRVEHRLAIAIGHLKKVKQMVEKGEYCIDILQQSLAVQSALRKVDELVLEGHLKSCVADSVKQGRADKAVAEVVEVFKKGRR